MPCAYNYQLDLSMSQEGIEELFHTYHNCREKPKIYHANGGVDIPRDDDDDNDNNDDDNNDVGVEKSNEAKVKTQS